MFEEYKDLNLLNFIDKFASDDDCHDYLSRYKWASGFVCSKCQNQTYWNHHASRFKRVCKSCRHVESVTANTLFHKLKFNIRKAFFILFELSSTTKGLSAEMVSRKYAINRKTAQLFCRKVRTAMKSSLAHPLAGSCEVDEAVVGGKQEGKRGRGAINKKKMAVVIQTNGAKGITRAYCQHIRDFSALELQKIFDKHIAKQAQVLTDEWTGYEPIAEKWNITQQKSKPKENFTLMHRFIQQFKAWLRGTHHHVSEKYFQGYLDEYCFRFNRHLYKESIFNKLVGRMMTSPPMYKVNINYL